MALLHVKSSFPSLPFLTRKERKGKTTKIKSPVRTLIKLNTKVLSLTSVFCVVVALRGAYQPIHANVLNQVLHCKIYLCDHY